MPTYTYECKKCGNRHDEFHGINANPRVKCEACGGACKRQIGTGSGIIFKGSGFYETDYKNKRGKPSDTGSDTASKSKDKGKDDSGKGSSDTKKSSGDAKKSESKTSSTKDD